MLYREPTADGTQEQRHVHWYKNKGKGFEVEHTGNVKRGPEKAHMETGTTLFLPNL